MMQCTIAYVGKRRGCSQGAIVVDEQVQIPGRVRPEQYPFEAPFSFVAMVFQPAFEVFTQASMVMALAGLRVNYCTVNVVIHAVKQQSRTEFPCCPFGAHSWRLRCCHRWIGHKLWSRSSHRNPNIRPGSCSSPRNHLPRTWHL